MQFLRGHYQNAYVTHDLDAAMALVDGRFGAIDWIVFEPGASVGFGGPLTE